jgi:hypothetical protein
VEVPTAHGQRQSLADADRSHAEFHPAPVK